MTDDPRRAEHVAHLNYSAVVAMKLGDEAHRLGRDLSLTEAEIELHLSAAQPSEYPDVPPRFDQYEWLAPGGFDPRVFDQGEVWVDVLRRPHRITDPSDFTDEHLVRVTRRIERQAAQWLGPDAEVEATPLMIALRQEAHRRAGDD